MKVYEYPWLEIRQGSWQNTQNRANELLEHESLLSGRLHDGDLAT